MTRFDCDHMASKLDELIDGTLDEPEASAALAHLESCTDCLAGFESVQSLLTAARELPSSIEPDQDLWPGIRAKIEDRRVVPGSFDRPPARADRRLWMAAAAAAILIVSVSIAYMAGLMRARTQIASTSTQTGVILAAYDGPAMELALARNQLRSSLNHRQQELSPETWSVVMENMAVIDDAIARIEHALADNPNDGRLNRQLAVAYLRQIDLLQRATRLPADA